MQYLQLLLFIIAGNMAFSQQHDSTVTDTVITKLQDDSDNADEITEDTTKKPEYNYYYSTELWTKDSFLLRQVPDSVIKSLQSDDNFWYANKDFEKKKQAANRAGISFWEWLARQRWYKAAAWIIIIGGFAAVLIWFLASSQVGIFRRRSKTVAEAGTGEMTENIFEIDYHKEIDKAMQEANYRLAVRLMFLRLLKNLSERHVIEYKQGRTNFDYLAQVNNSGYYKDFFRLTRNYEYAWYGEFAVSPEIFMAIKNDFENFEKQLN
ncbi:MAG: hypothetical protein JWM28_114 [Chitinophagaceae bacterium]|nr:hypothetical protein [Chitinophagaceae bacterium]